MGISAALASIWSTTSVIFMTVSTRPAAIARGSSERLVSAAEIVKTIYNARAWQWFSNFLLKAFVSRVNRLMLIRMVGLCLPASAGPDVHVQRLLRACAVALAVSPRVLHPQTPLRGGDLGGAGAQG